ncbi:MAG TPA: hypothetical protein PK339_01545 [Flavitalea sp.]|nr:hypothetical protein [Flavitalea sp.]
MSTAIPFILAWIVIAIPVFFLAYAIFLIKENKIGKYAAVYGRAALMVVLFFVIIGSYVFVPYLMGKAAGPTEYAVEGTYYSASSGDTLTLSNGKILIRGRIKADDITGNFSITGTNSGFESQFESGIKAMIGEYSGAPGRNRMLTMSWVDSSAYKKAIANQKPSARKNNNKNLNSTLKYKSASWWVETKSDTELTLQPTNKNNANKLFFTKL